MPCGTSGRKTMIKSYVPQISIPIKNVCHVVYFLIKKNKKISLDIGGRHKLFLDHKNVLSGRTSYKSIFKNRFSIFSTDQKEKKKYKYFKTEFQL